MNNDFFGCLPNLNEAFLSMCCRLNKTICLQIYFNVKALRMTEGLKVDVFVAAEVVDGSVLSQAGQTIVESPSPNVKTASN